MASNRPMLPTIVTTEPSAQARASDEPALLPPAETHSSSSGHARNASTDSQVPAVILTPVDDHEKPSTLSPALRLTGPPSSVGTDYPPSPVSSSVPFAGTTSTALRDNTDPEGKRTQLESQHLGVGSAAAVRRPSSGSVMTDVTLPATPYNEKDATFKEHAPGAAAAPGEGGDLKAGHVVMAPSQQSFLAKVPVVGRCFGGNKSKVDKAKEAEAEEEMDATKRKLQVRQLPDPTPEQLGPFANAPAPALNDLVDPKSIEHLESLGGFDGLVAKLHADPVNGLPDGDDESAKGAPAGTSIADRRRIYGENRLPARKTKSLLRLMWLALQDRVLIILSIAAVISLALGLYQDLGTEPEFISSPDCPNNRCELPQVDWVEGLAIMVAIAIVVLVGSVNDYQKERQFRLLNDKKEDRNVKAIRGGGRERLLNIHEVVVGDVLELEPGEILPVDGVLISGHNVRADESAATGESDQIRKTSYAEVMERRKAEDGGKADCFVLSGGKVVEGSGRYLVTAVGQRSQYGRLMMALQGDPENTPLQLKLNRMAEIIAWLGAGSGALLFVVLFIRFCVGLKTNPDRTPQIKAQNFIQILIIAVTVIVVAVPEGLPLAVTLALAFATRRMTKQNLLVRVLGSCETMANATVVCTDKTGTLTTNSMSVVAGSIGVHLKFAAKLAENADRSNANDDAEPSSPHPAVRRGRKDFSLDMNDINAVVKGPLRKLLNDSIAINSTAFEGTDEHGNLGGFVGSKTETALLAFAKGRSWPDYRNVRKDAIVAQMVPFSSERKAMGVVVKLRDGRHRLYLKGASEILVKLSTAHVVVRNPASQSIPDIRDDDDSDDVPAVDFNEETRGNISRTIIFYASQSLRTIALCYRDFESWPPKGANVDEEGQVEYEVMARSLTLAAITAIEDPLRDGVTKAVTDAQGAGVAIKMCTGDNVLTARSIATQCGIFTPGGLIMEGPVFRKLSEADRKEIVPRLQVLARSSPTDKELLVRHLREHGEVVGVTGDGLNDGPALKAANIGFSMGIAGTEVAKEASDIILMDDNFASIITAIMWGRAVNDAVRKFLQFQLSVNIVAVLLTFISAVASSDETSVLTAVQLLWVNLIMDTFAALALATDPATPRSLKRKPDRLTAPLISTDMWKLIIGQSIFQLTVTLVLHFAGARIFGYGGEGLDERARSQQDSELSTLVFNTFVWCQIFNVLNARVLDRSLNIFAGFFKNRWFLGIWAIMIGGQALIVNVGGAAFSVTRIGGRDWAISIVIGLLSLPIAVLIRLVPTEPITRFLIRMKLQRDPNAMPVAAPSSEEYNEAISKTIDHLQQFSRIKGGRLRSSSFVLKSRSARLDAAGVQPSSLMAMVPTLVASTIGGGWRPVKGGSLEDPASADPSRSTSHLYTHGISVHPDTDPNDELLRRHNIQVPLSPGGRSPSASISGSRPPSLGTPSPRQRGAHSRSGSVASHLSVGSPIATVTEKDESGHLRP